MKVLTPKVVANLDHTIRTVARKRGTSRSVLVRAATERCIDQDIPAPAKPSTFGLVREFAGSLHGPVGVAANLERMEGYGQ